MALGLKKGYTYIYIYVCPFEGGIELCIRFGA